MEAKENTRKRSLTVTTILTMLAIVVATTFTCRSMAQNISNKYADNVVVTLVNNDSGKISPGDQVQLHAVVKLGDAEAEMQYVNWSVSGNKDVNTKIDANGVLYIGTNEAVGDTLTVTAEAEIQFGVKGSISIDINTYSYYSLRAMPVGTTTTVTIDGVEWYILAKDGDKALLWSKNTVGKNYKFGTTNNWKNSLIRSYLNTELLNTLPTLKENVVTTNINTRTQYNAVSWYTTTDKMFLLSEADLFGQFNGVNTSYTKDYTYGNKVLVPNKNMRSFIGSTSYAWLRSPFVSTTGVPYVSRTGNVSRGDCKLIYSVRPALWVTMP